MQDQISSEKPQELDLLRDRAGAIGRTGERLGRILGELSELEQELDQMSQTLELPELAEEMRETIRTEMDLSINSYNYMREAAAEAYRQLILQRESCGFRGHALIQRCYPIPELILPAEAYELMDC